VTAQRDRRPEIRLRERVPPDLLEGLYADVARLDTTACTRPREPIVSRRAEYDTAAR
jgi:hypothetical protein